jgi:hypothetical protein
VEETALRACHRLSLPKRRHSRCTNARFQEFAKRDNGENATFTGEMNATESGERQPAVAV